MPYGKDVDQYGIFRFTIENLDYAVPPEILIRLRNGGVKCIPFFQLSSNLGENKE